MDLLASFLVLASAVGCFPTTRSYLLADYGRNNSLTVRHFILPVLMLIYVQLDYLDFAGRYFDSSASLSAKLEYIFGNAVYYLCDTYMRAFAFIYGSDLCKLIRSVRQTKCDLQRELQKKCHSVKQNRKFYISLALVIFCMQFIHMPLRCIEWWSMYTYPGDSADYFVLPKPSTLFFRIPLFALAEFAGIICRSMPLVVATFIGLDLQEVHVMLLAKSIRRESFREKGSKSESGDGDETIEVMKLKHLEHFFKEYNRIVGAYATVIISASIGNFIMEVMTLFSITKEPISNVMNTVAGVSGSLFGMLYVYIITSMGQRLENTVSAGRDEIRMFKLEYNGSECVQDWYKCLEWMESFKWKFTGWGLCSINFSLIPGMLAAIFSVAIFHLQLQISEIRCNE